MLPIFIIMEIRSIPDGQHTQPLEVLRLLRKAWGMPGRSRTSRSSIPARWFCRLLRF